MRSTIFDYNIGVRAKQRGSRLPPLDSSACQRALRRGPSSSISPTQRSHMDTPDSPESDALNALLEDERASVEIEVALFRSATDLSERDTFASMGAQEVGF